MAPKSVDVVIIGAGMAGIKAAADLSEAGLSIAVLEGQGRLGGRLYTDRASGSRPYELGCSWFHQSLDNPLLKLVLDEKLNIRPEYDDVGPAFFDNDGPIDPHKKLGQAAADFGDFTELYFKEHPKIQDLPLSDMVDIFTSEHRLLTGAQKKDVKRILQLATLPNGTEAINVSTKYCGQPALGRDVLPVGGFDVVFNHVKKPVSDDDIYLNTAVKSITKDETNGTITTASEDGTDFLSKFVIVTVPIGVLQNKDITFSPPLSNELSKAIDDLGVSRIGKIYFEFDNVFWPTDTHKFLFIGDINGEYTPVAISNWYLFNGEAKFPGLFLIAPSTIIDRIEKSPSSALSLLMPVLESLRVDKSLPVPKPTKTTVSNWNSDRFTRGAISRATIGNNPAESILEFEKGACGNIRFAGEHTIARGFTFVHGAWRSGAREAKYIIDQTK